LEFLSSVGFTCACGAATIFMTLFVSSTKPIACAGFNLMRDGDRQAAMAALMSCSVFACIISSSDLSADELQGECTEVIPPPHSFSHFGPPLHPSPSEFTISQPCS
jgi:hypothetical protein